VVPVGITHHGWQGRELQKSPPFRVLRFVTEWKAQRQSFSANEIQRHEFDCIVCTELIGCVQTIAKGARRPKSPFAGKLDLFFEGEISIGAESQTDLHTLAEVVLKIRSPEFAAIICVADCRLFC